MNDYQGVFDWVQFPEGRARFSGEQRGVIDEQGHETFAVEVGGVEYFGEIEAAFLSNHNDFNVKVVSFGYDSRKYIGAPMLEACRVFTLTEINIIQALIVKLIAAGMHFPDKPSLLMEFPNARFMDEVSFKDGWILVAEEAAA
jgi:hypothetical protein